MAELVGWRSHVIVPNVSWGLGLKHECDLLVLDKNRRFTEIEIKVTAQDLRRDFIKPHGHMDSRITRLVFAVPESILEIAVDLVPKHCGIISVKMGGSGAWEAQWIRRGKHRPGPSKLDEKTVSKFMELGCMRVWSLKRTLNQRYERARK